VSALDGAGTALAGGAGAGTGRAAKAGIPSDRPKTNALTTIAIFFMISSIG
jgi:hypothetical protein